MLMESTVKPDAIKPTDRLIKCLMVRDMQTQLGKVLLEGGEFVIYKGKEPYRYIKIKKIKMTSKGLTNEEYNERLKEDKSGQEKILQVE